MSSIHERFEINVPAREVYEALSQPERVVGSLPGVSTIYRYDRDRYRVDIGAAGRSDELDLQVTERVPPRRIAWRSSDGRWSGSIDVESMAERRTLVIVQVTDQQAPVGAPDSTDNAATVDAALRALKQSLETVAAGGAADDDGGNDVHVRHRTARERASSQRWREESAAAEDEGWRGGGRGLLKGGSDQALAVVRSLSREMDKLWDQVMRRAATAGRGTASFTGGWTPVIETCEHEDVWRLCAEVPGVAGEDLHVEVDPQLLVIRGERRSDNPEGAATRTERAYGTFVRRVPLPDGLRTEDARAQLRNGVLEVRIPVAKLKHAREVPVENVDAERSA